MLTTQYRMAEVIKGFSSDYFYNGKLETAPEVLHRENKGSLEFIDTAGCGFQEKTDPTSLSTYNPEEADLLARHLGLFPPNDGETVGVIAPYKAQLEFLKNAIHQQSTLAIYDEIIKINTVDAFQGQERDIIYISLVRSNDRSEIGFLKEYRRMNVALTRAKTRLVIVGDSATLGHDPFYQSLLEYVEKHAIYKSAFEYLYN